MGKVRLRKRRLRRLSLKWSFFLYAAVAVLAALAAIMLLTAICSELQNGLYHRWETRYGAQYRIPAQLVVDGEVVGEQMAYSTSLFELVPEEEYARYTLYGRITLLSYPVVSILSILTAGVLFYRRKLKQPLRKIEEAAGRIARNDLDFTIPALEKGNEMDRALAAMEKMRSALAEEKAADEVADEINEEAAETAEAAVEETAEEAPAAVSADVDGIARKIDELTARIDELLTPDEEDYEESAEETAAPVADVSGEIGEINRKIDELTARFEELISADEELGDEGEETAEAENAEEAEGEDEVKAELEAIRTALDEIRHDPAIQELKGEVAELTARIDELFVEPEEAEVAEGEEETDPVQAEFDEIKEKLEEIRNDPALQELKGEVAELTARIDELVARGAEESAEAEESEPADDAALGEIKEEIEDINRQLDQIKAMLAAGAVVAATAAAQPEEEAEQEEPVEEEPAEEPVAEEVVEEVAEEAEEPVEEVSEETSEETAEEVAVEEPETVEESEEETAVEAAEESAEEPAEEAASEEPAAEDEGEEEEEQLVTVSDIVDESELSDEPEDEVLENIFDDVEEQTVKGEAQPDGIPGISNGGVDFANMMKYNRSFIARIIQSSDDVKRYYGQIKNAMLAYKKVNSSIAWGAERFNKGRETIAKLKIRGKTLCLYLNLDPNEFKTSVYHQIDVSDNKSMHGTPMMVKVKSPLGVKKAIRLIDAMLAKRNGEKRPIQERDYAAMYPYETIEELIEDGLVKDVSKNK